MDLHLMFVRAQKLVADNSPLILTAIGVTGTITTAYLTGKATVKAVDLLHDEMQVDSEAFENGYTNKEIVRMTWRLYIPAAGTGLMTIACIITANRIGNRRAAALAAAFSVSEKAWEEYKEKVVEKLGKKEEKRFREEISQDRVNRTPVNDREIIITGNGDVLCFDEISGRYFNSNVENLRKSQNDINQQILHNMYASLYEFYQLIGLETTPYSTEVGWNSDCLLDLTFHATLAKDGKPCMAIGYRTFPIREYTGLH
jgi:hypothetical protein